MVARTSNVGLFNTGDVLTEAHVDSLPAGWLGYLPRTSDQTGITTEVDVSGVTVTLTLNANRRIRVTGYTSGFLMTSATGVAQLSVYDGAGQIAYARVPCAIANVSMNPAAVAVAVVTPGAGSHTYKLRASLVTGSGSVTIAADVDRACFILVEDIGPA